MDAYKHNPRHHLTAGAPRRGAPLAGFAGTRKRAKNALLCAIHAELDGKPENMLPQKNRSLSVGRRPLIFPVLSVLFVLFVLFRPWPLILTASRPIRSPKSSAFKIPRLP